MGKRKKYLRTSGGVLMDETNITQVHTNVCRTGVLRTLPLNGTGNRSSFRVKPKHSNPGRAAVFFRTKTL